MDAGFSKVCHVFVFVLLSAPCAVGFTWPFLRLAGFFPGITLVHHRGVRRRLPDFFDGPFSWSFFFDVNVFFPARTTSPATMSSTCFCCPCPHSSVEPKLSPVLAIALAKEFFTNVLLLPSSLLLVLWF